MVYQINYIYYTNGISKKQNTGETSGLKTCKSSLAMSRGAMHPYTQHEYFNEPKSKKSHARVLWFSKRSRRIKRSTQSVCTFWESVRSCEDLYTYSSFCAMSSGWYFQSHEPPEKSQTTYICSQFKPETRRVVILRIGLHEPRILSISENALLV